MNRNLSLARENLSNLVVTAPRSGQLTVFEANVGESKAPGQRIGQIDEQSAFKVSAFIDEFYLARVTIGQIATVDIENQTYELEVVKLYPDIRNRQFEADLAFVDDPPALVRRGQTVRMRLDIGQPSNTLVVENGAFFDDTGGLWVFLVGASGDIAERHAVQFGRRNPEGIEVIGGLSEGDRVITSTYENYMDFDRIQLQRTE
jgi:HlyD family secretion protein